MATEPAPAAGGDLPPVTFGIRMRMRRTRVRLSLVRLAALTDIPESTLRHYEQDRANPPLDKLESICRALQATPNQLLGWDGFTPESISRLDPLAPLPARMPAQAALAIVR